MNEAIATSGNNALVLDTAEESSLGKEVSIIEQKVSSVEITNDAGFAFAGELTKQIKQMQKKVKDYWEPLRLSAKKAYDDVLSKKKEMMDPLEGAEKILKKKIGAYTMEQERKAREAEELRRREAEAEMNRKLEEAAEAEARGDDMGADFAMAEAEVYDNYAATVRVEAQTPKTKGVTTSKTWRITAIDDSKVPCNLNGVILRPVDEGAVLRLIKASKGQIQIPGVVFEEDVTVSVRS